MSRRAPGEGTIYQEPSGLWTARLVMPDGKARRLRSTTKTQALKNLASLRRERDAGVVTPKTTVRDWLDGWLRSRAGAVKPKTLQSNVESARRIISVIGDMPIATLTKADVQRVITTMQAAGRSPHTIRQTLGLLRQALDAAVDAEHLVRNVAQLVELPTIAHVQPRPALGETAFRAVIDEATSRGCRARFLLPLATGMRQGEVLAVRLGDLDLAAEPATLTIQATRARHGWTHGPACVTPTAHSTARCPWRTAIGETGTPKSQAGRRVLAIPAVLVDALREQVQAVQTLQTKLGPAWKGPTERAEQFLFPSPTGRAGDPRRDAALWDSVITKATGRTGAGTHTARRTAITRMLERGVPVPTIMAAVGHTSAQQVAGYARVAADAQSAAFAAVLDG